MMKDNFKKAIEIFVDREKKNKDVIGIIISGSFVYGAIDKNSDIDVVIILASSCTYRERGNTWIEGVEIEYFKNPPQQLRSYFKNEKISPHTADMITNGIIVYQNSDVVDLLRNEAKDIINTQPNKINNIEIELGRYFIDDIYKDMEDTILKKDQMATNLIRNHFIEKNIELFCKINRIRRTKNKRLLSQLVQIDKHFAHILESALTEKWNDITSISRLKIEIEKLLGGSRPKEWVFRSNLDL